MKPWFKRGLAGVALALSAMVSHAQSFPDNKPITMVVPFAAGGPTDVVARMIAIPMGKALNTVVTVENTVGAGGTIAATRVASMRGCVHAASKAAIKSSNGGPPQAPQPRWMNSCP